MSARAVPDTIESCALLRKASRKEILPRYELENRGSKGYVVGLRSLQAANSRCHPCWALPQLPSRYSNCYSSLSSNVDVVAMAPWSTSSPGLPLVPS